MDDVTPAAPLDPVYAAALGAAVYGFASLEWAAVRGCEALQPGSMEDLSERTAGRVGDMLVSLAGNLPPSDRQAGLLDAARDFRALVATRNNLVHSRPDLAPDGSPALFRHGDPWMIAELQQVTELFAVCEKRIAQAFPVQADFATLPPSILPT